MSSIESNKKYSSQRFRGFSQLSCLSITLIAIFLSIAASAQPISGVVMNSFGQVFAEREVAAAESQTTMTETSLNEGSSLFSGDTLVTLENSRVRYELEDKSTYVLQQSSKLIISEYRYNENGNGPDDVAHFQFAAGVMEFVSGSIGKADEKAFRILTDFAEIGLRGSGAIITTDSNSTQVFVTKGELTGLGIDGQLVLLQEGETTIFDASGEPQRYLGNITGVAQTLGSDGSDLLLANDDDELDVDTQSANTIFRSLLPIDPNVQTPTRQQLVQTLEISINRYPDLYAELITVAIDLGLEPPTAALIVTDAFGSSGNLTEERVAEIFLAATAGISDPAAVELAILSVDGAVPVDLSPTDTNDYGQGLNDPLPTVPLDGQAASEAR